MSVETLLNMSCTIGRATVSRKKAGEEFHDWDNQPSGFPNIGVQCRLQVLAGKERFRSAEDVMITHKLFLAYGEDVTERDRITNVLSQEGTTLITRADIEHVNHDPGGMLNHTEIRLREVRTF